MLYNGSFFEQMRLDAIKGHVGIGTANPTTPLHVEGPVRIGVYTTATLPDPGVAGEGAIVVVRDGASIMRLAVSSGQTWV